MHTSHDRLIIRMEQPQDNYACELLAKKSFWNLHRPGCDEHYFVHRLRESEVYLPSLSRVAEQNGEIIGLIMYSRAFVLSPDGTKTELLSFGPLCVDPLWQNTGVGGSLLLETLEHAKNEGFKAVIIFGEPDYYPRFGFKTCDNFGITTVDGKNFSAFMALELVPGALNGVTGRYIEPEIFHDLPENEVEEFDKHFPHMQKLKLPGQWS